MDRLKKLWRGEQLYEPIENDEAARDGEGHVAKRGFSYIDYGIFLLLGVSMLWAWNMFLAAGPYFRHRFRENEWIRDNFQAAEISVSTVTNLGSMLVLTRLQANASYPKRIILSLLINLVVFALLAISTAIETSAGVYFGCIMVMMFCTSLATGFSQNGVFAYVNGYGEASYTQGIMTGQAVAGVLPPLAQIISVLSTQPQRHIPQHPGPSGPALVPWTAALTYFLTATVISVGTLFAFLILLARNPTSSNSNQNSSTAPEEAAESAELKSIPLLRLLRKLFWLAGGVFVTFAITMVFPVFTQLIVSVRPPDEQPPLLHPPSFIPLALLVWNIGDLLGRLLTAVPSLSLVLRPRIIFGLALSRIAFIGLYHLCNLRDQGAVIESDFFYLVVVQLFFGISNGYLGSTCMIGAGVWVEPDESASAGAFMGLSLVAGLTAGSLLSFLVTGI